MQRKHCLKKKKKILVAFLRQKPKLWLGNKGMALGKQQLGARSSWSIRGDVEPLSGSDESSSGERALLSTLAIADNKVLLFPTWEMRSQRDELSIFQRRICSSAGTGASSVITAPAALESARACIPNLLLSGVWSRVLVLRGINKKEIES